ncbi:MAG: DNA gyrase subunit A [Oscillospiraceae bacterium]|nr:DNA gyrase subunit A [Oscillospiraceae bacterium]
MGVDIEKEMKKSFLDYSMSVIVSRALPDVRDGLKPVHRRILYTMYEAGLTPDKKYLKCAATVGDVLGKYHPHGDASVYDALVRLAQSFSMRYPLVDGHGNFGSMDGDPPAAYRYTEAKMAKMSLPLVADIEKETVDWMSNYDDRLQEPTVLPAKYPNLLVNGSIGIAVGMATNIPPHNLTEVIDGLLYYISKCYFNSAEEFTAENFNKSDEIPTFDELMQYIQGPDFPTGAMILGKSGIRSVYATGKGSIKLRAQTHFENIGGREVIVADSVPYMTNKAEMEKRIDDLVRDKKIAGVHKARDESNKDGIRFVVELKKDANKEIVLNKLYALTDFQKNFSVNMLALVDGIPKTLTLVDYLREYLKHQEDVITRRTRFELRKAKERAHILEGLAIAVDNVDEVVNILKNSANIPEGKINLETRFSIDSIQSEAIVQMTIGRITGLEKQKIMDELEALLIKIKDLEDILVNEYRVLAIVKEELLEIRKKYGDVRKTEIVEIDGDIDDEDLIPVTECVITYTNVGYIKRIPVDAYKSQGRGGKGVSAMKQREEDFVSQMIMSSTHDFVLFFTNLGRVYKLKGYQLPEGSKQSKGMNIVNILPLMKDETVCEMLRVTEFDDTHYIVTATKKGLIKRTRLSEFKNVMKSGKKAIALDEDDEIAGVKLTDGTNDLIIASHNGKALRFSETKVRASGRTAHGVKGIKLAGVTFNVEVEEDIEIEDNEIEEVSSAVDYVVGLARVRDGATLLTITDKGYGKRSSMDDYPTKGRGGKGSWNTTRNYEKIGYVCGIKVVDDTDDIIIISDNGVIIRVQAIDIRCCSRTSGGVRVMRLNGDNKVVTFTRTEHDEEEEFDTILDSEVISE